MPELVGYTDQLERFTIASWLREEDFQPAAANRALELLGRKLGMFSERRDLTVFDGDLDKLSPEQLASLQFPITWHGQILAGCGETGV